MPLPIYSYGQDLAAFRITDDPEWRYDEGEDKLTNPINPIWKRDNIRVAPIDMSDDDALVDLYNSESEQDKVPNVVYERMRPAFQLASLMLEASGSFFATVRCAKVGPKKYRRYEEPDGKGVIFCTVGELDRGHVESQETAEICCDIWAELEAKYRTIFRNDPSPNPWDLEQNHGSTTYVDCDSETYLQTGNPRDFLRLCFTDIEVRFWEFFRADQANPFQRASAQARNRYWFELAILLLHELAHAVWMFRDRDGNGEPLYNRREPQIELGFAWETYFLGGIVRQQHGRLRSSEHCGLTWYVDRYIAANLIDAGKFMADRHCGILAVSINQFFCPKRWDVYRRTINQAARSPTKPQGIIKQRSSRRQRPDRTVWVHEDSLILELTPQQVFGLFSQSEPRFDSTYKYWLDAFRRGEGYIETTVDEVLQGE